MRIEFEMPLQVDSLNLGNITISCDVYDPSYDEGIYYLTVGFCNKHMQQSFLDAMLVDDEIKDLMDWYARKKFNEEIYENELESALRKVDSVRFSNLL